MKLPETIEELQAIVTRDTPQNKTKFVVKILAILNFTKEHPEHIINTGGSWMADGKHFITNSRILSEFMRLKINSVNTNFRDHGFSIFPNATTQMRTQFPEIPDICHWKIRVHLTVDFSIQTTLEKANIMTIANRFCTMLAQKISFPFTVPKEMLNTFFKAGTYTVNIRDSICKLYSSLLPNKHVQRYQEWFSKIVVSLASTWISEISPIPETTLREFITYLIEKQRMISKEAKIQLVSNLTYILSKQETPNYIDKPTELFTFDLFVEFFLRYGCDSDYLQSFKEVTYFDQSPLASKAKFVHWFSPCSSVTSQVLGVGDWLLTPAERVNAFALHYRSDKGISYVHIFHDPFEEQTKRYFVEFEDGMKSAPTLREMLKNVMYLDLAQKNRHRGRKGRCL